MNLLITIKINSFNTFNALFPEGNDYGADV